MNSQFLGRTNEAFSPVWLRLTEDNSGIAGQANDLAIAAAKAGAVLDVSANPAKWGGLLRGTNAMVMACGGEFLQATESADQASDFLQAHLLELLCSVGRQTLDFYFLNLPRTLEEFQIQSALETLEIAKQEGTIRFSGIHASGEPFAALGHWQFNDAFEVALVPRNLLDEEAYNVLGGLAQERRVGLIANRPLGVQRVPILDQSGPEDETSAQILKSYLEQHTCLIPVSDSRQIQWLQSKNLGLEIPRIAK